MKTIDKIADKTLNNKNKILICKLYNAYYI